MSLVRITPTRNVQRDTRGVVSVSFPRLRRSGRVIGCNMVIHLGKDIAELVGINHGDMVWFSMDSQNERKWFIEKSKDGLGWKAVDTKRFSGKLGDNLRIQMTWKFFEPRESEISVRKVHYEVKNGGVFIFLNGAI